MVRIQYCVSSDQSNDSALALLNVFMSEVGVSRKMQRFACFTLNDERRNTGSCFHGNSVRVGFATSCKVSGSGEETAENRNILIGFSAAVAIDV